MKTNAILTGSTIKRRNSMLKTPLRDLRALRGFKSLRRRPHIHHEGHEDHEAKKKLSQFDNRIANPSR